MSEGELLNWKSGGETKLQEQLNIIGTEWLKQKWRSYRGVYINRIDGWGEKKRVNYRVQ